MFRYFHIAFLLLFNGFNISCGASAHSRRAVDEIVAVVADGDVEQGDEQVLRGPQQLVVGAPAVVWVVLLQLLAVVGGTSKNNQDYSFANYSNQQYQSNNQNNQNNSPILSPPLIEKTEDEPNDYNFEPNKPKIGPVIEVPSFGVPYPGEDNNEKGYEFSSGIFVHNNNNDTGYSSGYGGYGFSQ